MFKRFPRHLFSRLKGSEQVDAELSRGQGDLMSCCFRAETPDCHHSSKLQTDWIQSPLIWCQTTCMCEFSCPVVQWLYMCLLQFFVVTPCSPGRPGPCTRPARRPGDLWSSTCRRPAGCPVVLGSRLVGQHLGLVRGRRARQNRRAHAVHRGLSTNARRYSDWMASINSYSTT